MTPNFLAEHEVGNGLLIMIFHALAGSLAIGHAATASPAFTFMDGSFAIIYILTCESRRYFLSINHL